MTRSIMSSMHGRNTRPLRGEALAPGMRIGLFGGTFDPPHKGHLHLARLALRRLGLHRVWWLVSPQNPLKTRKADALSVRLQAIEQIAQDPGMVVTDIEARLGTHKTIDLIEHLQCRYPRVNFVWLMGADNLTGFHRWARWQDIARSIPIAVIARPQDPLRARLSRFARMHSASRMRETNSRKLPLSQPPAWTYLTEPLEYASSTSLRAAGR